MEKNKKLAIIGASYLQKPLIEKAKKMGIETHVFAWAVNDVGEKCADFFYPISITEKEKILEECKKIRIDGICSIASDLAAITVNYVAEQMGLVGNSSSCVKKSTNKYWMRKCFEACGDPSPKSMLVESVQDLEGMDVSFPVIVKPLDRSGSRGITKLENAEGIENAIEDAKHQGFKKYALIEEFVEGQEYSIECISYNGVHYFLAITRKYTTGAPHFIETAHVEPGMIDDDTIARVKKVVFHALDSLEITNSASHTEIKIDNLGRIYIIEIGGRMGGDCIGSHLVEMSTGFDFVKAVIQVALGEKIDVDIKKRKVAAIRYVFNQTDIKTLEKIKMENPEILREEDVKIPCGDLVTDSSTRFGYYILEAENEDIILKYLPLREEKEDE